MEESKELQSIYKIFRALIYVSLIMEFFVYAFKPDAFSFLGFIGPDIWMRIKQWTVYADGHIIYSKVMTFLIVCVTCIGTINKKQLEFNYRTMVAYPIIGGALLLTISVIIFWFCQPLPEFKSILTGNGIGMDIYMLLSIIGTILIEVGLDNCSKHLKEQMMKDRFNFENESFQQMEEEVYNDYSVNIPMKYYYKGGFRFLQLSKFQLIRKKQLLRETKQEQI